MSGFNNQSNADVVNHFLGTVTWTPPTTFQISLYKGDPNGAGVEVTTSNWTNYARVAYGNGGSNWSTASAGNPAPAQNSNTVDFGTAVTGADETGITHFGVHNATGGALVAAGTLTSTKTVQNGDPVRFDPGDLTVQAQRA